MNNEKHDQLNQATAGRLSKLGNLPVDTSVLENNLRRCIDDDLHQTSSTFPLTHQAWWKPISGLAAAIVLITCFTWIVFNSSDNVAMASPVELAEIHHEVIGGHAEHYNVTSIQQANTILSGKSSNITPLPALPGTIKSCCLHQYQNVTLTCALILDNTASITIAIADEDQMHTPDGQKIIHNRKQFIIHTMNGLQMVMTYHHGRWLCVMGEVSQEKLIQIADAIVF